MLTPEKDQKKYLEIIPYLILPSLMDHKKLTLIFSLFLVVDFLLKIIFKWFLIFKSVYDFDPFSKLEVNLT